MRSLMTRAATVVLLMVSLAGAAPRGAAGIDGSVCESIPFAPVLISKDYASLPARHSARSVTVTGARRLLDEGALTITTVVKKSIAQGNPVLFTTTTQAFETGGGLWALSGGKGTRAAGGAMVAVGYDDAQHGGAFEVMTSGGADGDGFFWIRYEDFDRYCHCAVEVVGGDGSPANAGKLSGALRFEHASGVVMHAQRYGQVHRLQRAYPTGTRFRILVASNGPAYVYLFASDVTRKVYPIFPSDGATPHLAYQKNDIAIPGEAKYLQLDDRPGTDSFCALYSTKQLDFGRLVRQVEEAKGDFVTRVQTAIGEDLIPLNEIRYPSAGTITFTADRGEKSAAFLVVEMEHLR
jgi:hypothetical protein